MRPFARNPARVAFPEGAGTFAPDLLALGEIFETTLTIAGDYKYFCRPHEMMGHVGTIKVIAA